MSPDGKYGRRRDHHRLTLRQFFRKAFLEDWPLKLTAVGITLGLWFGVTGLSEPTTRRINVGLVARISNNTEITSQLDNQVVIVVSGDRRRIDQINTAELQALLDLTEMPPGDRTVSLSPENVFVSLPQGVKLVEVQPSRIAVRLEAVEERDVEVRATTKGEIAPGFEIYGITVVPQKVRVRAPAGYLRDLAFVSTEPIDISGRRDDVTARQTRVIVENPNAAVLNTVVDVGIRIGERRIERFFTIPLAGTPGRTATFTLFGPRSLVTKVRPDAIRVDVIPDLAGDDEPHLVLPPEMDGVVQVRDLTLKQRSGATP
jgi:hypothetical protein